MNSIDANLLRTEVYPISQKDIVPPLREVEKITFTTQFS